MKIIDAHIHLDQYRESELAFILEESSFLEALVSVSNDLDSCKENLQLSNKYRKVKAAFGLHPEQSLPNAEDFNELIQWISQHQNEMIAIGEVGLPYYLRQEGSISSLQYEQYVEYLETFIQMATEWNKPIVLHAVYDDAPVVCDLLEKHSVKKAHFHWFKGDEKTVTRMIENGYYISITPELVYKDKIQKLVQTYPIEQMMVETDGPWRFEGPFLGEMTHPSMLKQSIAMIAKIKSLSDSETAWKILDNTKAFYGI